MRPREKHPYTAWEDYCAGMYGLTWRGTQAHAVTLLSTPDALLDAMRRAVQEWPKAAAHHLTDGGMNQQAWLGWAACGIAHEVPAHLTRSAWWQLSDAERLAANGCADAVIAEYDKGQTLFDMECV